ncbi:MAG: hypothetical protein JNJ54_13255 [Myxococcaceae bacterium]|nr:hypothetical protein [Myxococcaceae bacterium]
MGDEAVAGGGELLRPGYVRPSSAPIIRTSRIHFDVNPTLPEVVAFAEAQGWRARGFTAVSIAWQELHWTSDGWATVNKVASTDVPCPITGGWFSLQAKPGTPVEFAVRVGLQCRAPQDTAGARETGELWFNNAGSNYAQVTT